MVNTNNKYQNKPSLHRMENWKTSILSIILRSREPANTKKHVFRCKYVDDFEQTEIKELTYVAQKRLNMEFALVAHWHKHMRRSSNTRGKYGSLSCWIFPFSDNLSTQNMRNRGQLSTFFKKTILIVVKKITTYPDTE